MLFLNMGLLVGLLAISIPIIIHLLNRRSAKFIDWGAIQFLMDSMVSRRRRILLEEVLLLIARCLLLALVVLAMARPFIPAESRMPWLFVLPGILFATILFGVSFAVWEYPRWRKGIMIAAAVLVLLSGLSILFEKWLNLRRFGGAVQHDVVLVIDSSTSMNLKVDGISNFDRAIEEAQAIVESARWGNAFGIIVGGAVPSARTDAPLTDREEIKAIIAEARPVGGTMPVPDTLAAAADLLARGKNAVKQIVLLTDGQSEGWQAESPSRWSYVAASMERLPTRPQVIYRRFAVPDSIRNVAVAEVSYSRAVVGTDREVFIDVRVVNSGTEAVTPEAVELAIGGDVLSDNTIGQLAPGASETVRFGHHFKKAGGHAVVASVMVEDDLSEDNTFSSAIGVIGKLRVLIVDGNPAARFMDRAAAFVALAMAPSATTAGSGGADGEGGHDFLLEPEVVDAVSMVGRESFDEFSVVVLADVPRLPAAVAEKLAMCVADGAGLLIAPGRRSVAEFYNSWSVEGLGQVTPAEMAERVLALKNENISPALSSFNHPALKLIADRSRSDLGAVSISAYWRLSDAAADQSVSVGARLNTGVPFIVQRRFGKGFVMMSACAFDAFDSNLATRHTFLPLIHEAVYYLANPAGTELNVMPAAKLSVLLAGKADLGSAVIEHGLVGSYYNGLNFEKFIVKRVDKGINFPWNGQSPGDGVPGENISVRWTGSVSPEFSEEYTFHATTDDGVRLWVNDKQIINDWTGRPATESRGKMELQAGWSYDVVMEFYQGGGPSYAQLSWSSRSTPKAVIPTERLSTSRGMADRSKAVAVSVKGPGGEQLKGSVKSTDEGIVASLDDGVMPGLYHISADNDFLMALAGESNSIPFTVIRDEKESNLAGLEDDDLNFLRKYIAVLEPESLAQVADVLAGRAFGKELWKYLAVAALLFLLGEVALARWVAKRRRTGMEKTIDFEEYTQPSASFRQQLERVKTVSGAGLSNAEKTATGSRVGAGD
jgi:hypothetical protein